MANDELAKRISQSSGIALTEVTRVLGQLPESLGRICARGDSIAFPGFGSIAMRKINEQIVTDADGRRQLVPPSLRLVFRPSVLLRKKLNNG